MSVLKSKDSTNGELMRYMMSLLIIVVLFLSTEIAFAQSQDDEDKTGSTDSTHVSETDSSASEILLYPDALPARTYVGWSGEREFLNTNIVLNSKGAGVEFTYFPEERYGFFSLAFSTLMPDDNSGIRTNMMTSLTAGYRLDLRSMFSTYTNENESFRTGSQFYLRVGPGISLLKVDRRVDTRMESERLIGLHTIAMVGTALPIAERSRFNIEVGWRGLWFPGSERLKYMGGPMVTFGFSFTGSDSILPVNW